jgi:uncharacterized FlgJ-related protein
MKQYYEDTGWGVRFVCEDISKYVMFGAAKWTKIVCVALNYKLNQEAEEAAREAKKVAEKKAYDIWVETTNKKIAAINTMIRTIDQRNKKVTS